MINACQLYLTIQNKDAEGIRWLTSAKSREIGERFREIKDPESRIKFQIKVKSNTI